MKKTLEDLQIKPSKKAELCCRAMDLSRRDNSQELGLCNKPATSEAGADVNKAAPLVTPTTRREGGAIHLKLLVDPAKDDWPNLCRERLTAKTAKTEVVCPLHQHQAVIQARGLAFTHRSDRFRTRRHHPIAGTADQQQLGWKALQAAAVE